VIFALPSPGLAPALRLYVRTHMHVREVHPKEERVAGTDEVPFCSAAADGRARSDP